MEKYSSTELKSMERNEALSLLKDLMATCDSIRFASIVSLTPTPDHRSWTLNIKWDGNVPNGCLEKIVRDRGLQETETEDGHTIFYTL
jgi:hypothetical protein